VRQDAIEILIILTAAAVVILLAARSARLSNNRKQWVARLTLTGVSAILIIALSGSMTGRMLLRDPGQTFFVFLGQISAAYGLALLIEWAIDTLSRQ
jgi:uncharacterized membrane protein